MTLQSLAVLAAFIASVVSLGGTVLKAKGKWDTTNALLTALVKEVEGNERSHHATHARMDRRTDELERRLFRHVGQHRRV